LETANLHILDDLAQIIVEEESLTGFHRELDTIIHVSEEYSRTEKEKMEAIKMHWNLTLSFAPVSNPQNNC
jgi:hypothetical protein